MPEPRRRGTGTITKIAIAALVLIVVAMAALQLRGGPSATAGFVAEARAATGSGVDLIERAAANHRFLFVADVPSASAPKDLVVSAIERLARGNGLDVVALEVDSDEQPYIDRYLSTSQEDASILLNRPRLIREDEGVSRAFLEVFRAVRRMNDQLGPDRQIRIVALDLHGWPPSASESPSESARRFGQRDSVMFSTIAPILDADPKTRVLFFVGGLHVLKAGTGVVQTGGTRTVEAVWLATRLFRLYPQDVYSILVDATPSRIPVTPVVSYRATSAGPVLRDARSKTGIGMLTGSSFDFSRHPIDVVEKPGIHFNLSPADLKFGTLADAYIYLGS